MNSYTYSTVQYGVLPEASPMQVGPKSSVSVGPSGARTRMRMRTARLTIVRCFLGGVAIALRATPAAAGFCEKFCNEPCNQLNGGSESLCARPAVCTHMHATVTTSTALVMKQLTMATFLQIGPPGPGPGQSSPSRKLKFQLQPDHCLCR